MFYVPTDRQTHLLTEQPVFVVMAVAVVVMAALMAISVAVSSVVAGEGWWGLWVWWRQ